MVYVIEPGTDFMFYIRAYSPDPYLTNQYVKQMSNEKIKLAVSTYPGTETELLQDPKMKFTVSDRLKPRWSCDKSKMIVVSEHLENQLRYTIPESYMSGFLSNIVTSIAWITLIFDHIPSLRENFDPDQLQSIQVLLAYAISVLSEGVGSSSLDHIMLISNLWGW